MESPISIKTIVAFFLGVVTATGLVGVFAYHQHGQHQQEMRLSNSAIIFSGAYSMVDTMHHIFIDDTTGLAESEAVSSVRSALLMDKWLAEEIGLNQCGWTSDAMRLESNERPLVAPNLCLVICGTFGARGSSRAVS